MRTLISIVIIMLGSLPLWYNSISTGTKSSYNPLSSIQSKLPHNTEKQATDWFNINSHNIIYTQYNCIIILFMSLVSYSSHPDDSNDVIFPAKVVATDWLDCCMLWHHHCNTLFQRADYLTSQRIFCVFTNNSYIYIYV